MDSIRREAATTMRTARRSVAQAFAMEAATPKHMAELALHYPRLLMEPRGNGDPVMVVPGYAASDRSTASLRRYLELMGHEVHGWELGRNTGNVEALTGPMVAKVERLHRGAGKRVSLIGWSMGGNICREVALSRPQSVRRVITMGSPIIGGPKYTAFAAQLAGEGVDLDAIEQHLAFRQRHRQPFRVPVTAIFSRRDGVVAWQACVDQVNHAVEHVEVNSSHIGLGFDPAVYRVIARKLANLKSH